MANPASTNNHVKGQKIHEKVQWNAAERAIIDQIDCQLTEIHVMNVNYILTHVLVVHQWWKRNPCLKSSLFSFKCDWMIHRTWYNSARVHRFLTDKLHLKIENTLQLHCKSPPIHIITPNQMTHKSDRICRRILHIR